MRILHVNKFLYRRGGAEAYLFDLADLQRDAGHVVEYFGMAHPDNEKDLRYAPHFPAEVQFDPPPASIKGRLVAAGRMIHSPSARRGMQHVIEDFKPDVVHLHNIYHQLSPSILAPAERAGIPVVMTVHDAKLVCPTYLFLDKGELCEACVGGHFHQAVLRRCKDGSLAASGMAAVESTIHHRRGAYSGIGRFICPSNFLAGKLREGGVYPDRVRVLENFVDVTSARPRPAAPTGPVTYAGRLSSEKGVDVLVRAAATIAAPVLIIGDGPERTALEQLAADVAPGRVTFLGRVPKTEVMERFSQARVVVLPSRCHENQPMTVLEAFASGAPVVASDLGGVPELLEDGSRGLTVPHDDPGALATAVNRLLGDPAEAERLGQAGRAFLGERFGPGRHLDVLGDLYAEAERDAAA